MKRFAFLVLLALGTTSIVMGQSASELQIQLLKPSDLREELGCSFDFARPEGTNSIPGVVLQLASVIAKEDIFIRVNGELLQLKWSPKQIRSRHNGFSGGAWSNGKVTVQLDCTDSSNSENSSYYDGILEIRVGKKHKQYKVTGFCGC